MDSVEFIDEAEVLLLPFVEEVNDYIDSVNVLEGKSIDFIEPQHIYIAMIRDFMEKYGQSTMSEMLVRTNPYLAIELGFLTLREALREGAIRLTKNDVLNKTISYRELSKDVIEALGFTPEEYKKLRQ